MVLEVAGRMDEDRHGESATNFRTAALAFRAQQATVGDLVAALRVATLFALRPVHPGLFVFQAADGSAWTSVFTSLDGLGRHLAERGQVGPADYFSTTGADLLDNLLPPDVGLLVDPGQVHAVALPPRWLGGLPSHTWAERNP